MRVRFCIKRMTVKQADIAEYSLSAIVGGTRVQVFDRTCDVVISYTCPRAEIVKKLSCFSFDDEKNISLVPEQTGRQLRKHYEEKLAAVVIRRCINKLILPQPIRRIMAVIKAARYIFRGLKCLLKGRLEVSVLDATAIGVSLLRGDFKTAGSVMFLLNVGDILDEWTHRKSIDDLARTMSLGVEQVWTKTADGQELLMPVNDVRKGDMIVVRTGSMIPLDGKVLSGDAMVNQASMTGESVPVHKSEGAYVYAGTVVEDGECTVCVENTAGGGRYDRIVKMIEESEKLKSSAEDKASHLADKLVPWSLGCTPPDERIFRHLPKEYSHLYLAIGGEVAAVICIEDPLREEAADVVKKLHEYGISRVVMMTGDNERTAKAVAEKVGVDEYHAEVLPEDKAAFIRAEHEAGGKVIMIGDGVNDSPALSEADAGIAISTGAAIAREIADITISADDLYAIVELKRMSNALMKRIGWNYRTIIGFNGGLIGLGVLGVLPPATSALLHNASTLAIGLRSMTELK